MYINVWIYLVYWSIPRGCVDCVYIEDVYTVFIPGHKLQIINEHGGATLLRGYMSTEYVPTRGIIEKNNPLIMYIFIGLGTGTHKIEFFLNLFTYNLHICWGKIYTSKIL